MRAHYLVLVAVAAVIAILDAASATMEVKLIKPESLVVVQSPLNIPTKRLLRVQGTAKDDEERMITVPAASKLTDSLKTAASKLVQSSRIKVRLVKGKTVDDAFAKLELNMAGNKILEDHKFLTWVVMTKVEKQNPEEIILAKLMKQYTPDSLAKMLSAAKKDSMTEGLATMLQAQQRPVWLNTGKSTDKVFNLLKLDEAGTKLFKSPQFSTWSSYVDAFNRKNPSDKVSIFTKLAKSYDDAILSKMLEAAKMVPSTQTIATKLQAQQIEAWLSAAKSPDDVFKLLKLDNTGVKLFESPQITTWTSFVDAFNKKTLDRAVSIFAKLAKSYDEVTLSSMLEAAKGISSTKRIASYLQAQQN